MKKRILIIDDDLGICVLLSRFLNQNGYDSHTADSAKKGLSKLKESQYDAVLCDFRLGDGDAKEILIAIKELNIRPIAIIMTGYSDIKTAVAVMKLGAYGYLTKPLIPTDILEILSNAFMEFAPKERTKKVAVGV